MQPTVRSTFVLILASLSGALVGCGDERSQPGGPEVDGKRLVACDPWNQDAPPVELGTVLGAGRAEDDRLYVIDRDSAPHVRLFVSDGDLLVRQSVVGTGTESDGGIERMFVSGTLGSTPIRVLLERREGSRRMLLLEGDDAAGRDIDLANPRGKHITIVGEDLVRPLEVRNLPALSRVEYAAQVEPDDHLVVLGPEHLESFDDYVLFFGRSDRVSQREVLVFGRGRDGGTTTIDFDLDGETARAHFPNRIQRDGPPITEPVTFEVDGSPRAITKLPKERASTDGLSFECLR